ncbi:alcohol dehydrogenase AdhP [Dactylosporangium salmoneum]|uniref:Alcohol dehydrogenase AdhP n=1 Tax=Dactylosporangium salmoneum TaxID=53361 RepID=A0ABP5V954_9ACTN
MAGAPVKALSTEAVGSLTLREQPSPGHDGRVVVRSAVAGICATDVHLLDGFLPRPDHPFVLGHEGAGVVASVPSGVTGLRPGDRVVLYSPLVCGRCRECARGREEVCADPRGQLGFSIDGTFADEWSAPASNLVVLPDSVSFELGALLGCAGLTAVHAVRLARLGAGDVAVVNGVGGVGLMLIQVAAACGAAVLAVADAAEKCAPARQAGASDVVVLGQGGSAAVIAELGELTGGRGADHYFDLVGTRESLEAGIDALARYGTAIVLTSSGDLAGFDPRAMLLKQTRLIGSLAGSLADLHTAVRLAEQGALTAQIDRRYALRDATAGLARIRNREALGRNIIVW